MRLEGRTIIMRNEPPPLPLRISFGIVGLLFAAIGTVMAFNLVQQLFRTTGGEATAWGWALGITLTILFSGAAAICLHVALRPARELRIDPGKRQATLLVSGPLGEKREIFDLLSLARPTATFTPEIGENAARYAVVIDLPNGTRMDYHDPTLSLDQQKQFAETWRDRISDELDSCRG